MPELMTREAEEIVVKLQRDQPQIEGRRAFTARVEQGSKHALVKIWYGQIWIGQYGIRRGSKPQRHNYIADQIYLTRTQAYRLAKCPFSVDDYIEALIGRQQIEAESAE